MKKTGFSLIELIVVVGIIAGLTGFIVPKFSNFSRQQSLQTESQKLLTALKNIQNNAISGIVCSSQVSAKEWYLVFAKDANNKIYYKTEPDCSGAAPTPAPSTTFKLPDEVVVDEVSSCLTNGAIEGRKIGFTNIQGSVKLYPPSGCSETSFLFIALKSMKTNDIVYIVVEKGGSIYITSTRPNSISTPGGSSSNSSGSSGSSTTPTSVPATTNLLADSNPGFETGYAGNWASNWTKYSGTMENGSISGLDDFSGHLIVWLVVSPGYQHSGLNGLVELIIGSSNNIFGGAYNNRQIDKSLSSSFCLSFWARRDETIYIPQKTVTFSGAIVAQGSPTRMYAYGKKIFTSDQASPDYDSNFADLNWHQLFFQFDTQSSWPSQFQVFMGGKDTSYGAVDDISLTTGSCSAPTGTTIYL